MSRPLIILLGLLAFGLFAWWSISHHRFQIQENVELRANDAVKAAGFHSVDASADGRDITLTGSVADARQRLAAENYTAKVDGVRVVDNQIAVSDEQVLAEPTALALYRVSVAARADSVFLTGTVNSAAERDWLETQLSGAFPDVPIENTVEIGAGEFEPAHDLFAEGVYGLTEMVSGTLDIDSRGMRINGSVKSELQRMGILQGFEELNAQYESLRVEGTLAVQELIAENVVTEEVVEPNAAEQNIVEENTVETAVAESVSEPVYEIAETTPVVTTPSEQLNSSDCQRELNALIQSEKILFDNEAAEVNVESYALLDSLVAVAQRCSENIEIGGHTDSRGEDAYNDYLSDLRAKAVLQYLVDAGIDAGRLTAVGYGASQPIEGNETLAQRAANRRIEFRVMEEQE